MTQREMMNTARELVMQELQETNWKELDPIQYADNAFAVLKEVDGQEMWVSITFTTKSFKPTKVNPAFDPFVAQQEWLDDKEYKAQEKAQKKSAKEKVMEA